MCWLGERKGSWLVKNSCYNIF